MNWKKIIFGDKKKKDGGTVEDTSVVSDISGDENVIDITPNGVLENDVSKKDLPRIKAVTDFSNVVEMTKENNNSASDLVVAENKGGDKAPPVKEVPRKKMGILLKCWCFVLMLLAGFYLYMGLFSIPIEEGSAATQAIPWELPFVKQGLLENSTKGPGRVLNIPNIIEAQVHPCPLRYIKFTIKTKYLDPPDENFNRPIPGTGISITTPDRTDMIVEIIFPYKRYQEVEYDEEGKMIHGALPQLSKKTALDLQREITQLTVSCKDMANRYLGVLRIDEWFMMINDYYDKNGKLIYKDVENPNEHEVIRELPIDKLHEALKNSWAKYGIEFFRPQLQTFYPADPEIENQIFQKSLKKVKQRNNEAKEDLADQKIELEKVESTGRANRDAEITRGETEALKLQAEGDQVLNQAKYEGEKVYNQTEGEILAAKRDALNQLGGDRVRRIYEAEALWSKVQGGVISDNPLSTIKKGGM